MTVKIEGLDSVLANIRNIIPAETAKMNARLALAGGIVESNVKQHASETDHSLADLAAMGHPYSRRYSAGAAPHPDDVVHQQSGTLYANIEKSQDLNAIHSTVAVGVDESKVPYIGDLITGTSKMRPRNFLGGAFRESLGDVITTTQGG